MSIKGTNRSLFLAMQADAKDFPGGIRALADSMGRNASTLGNSLNPDHDNAPPSLEVLVELIKVTPGKRTVFALAQLVDQVTMDIKIDHQHPSESVRLFFRLLHEASEVFSKGSEFADDFRFSGDERRELEPLLMGLLKATAEVLVSMRG